MHRQTESAKMPDHESCIGVGTCGVTISVVAGGQSAPVDHGASPGVSPDGTRIAFLSNRSGQSQVFVIQADGTGEMQVTFSPEEKNRPQWIDRETIVFSVTDGDQSRMYAIDVDGNICTKSAQFRGGIRLCLPMVSM